jgi:hypothetical protein
VSNSVSMAALAISACAFWSSWRRSEISRRRRG